MCLLGRAKHGAAPRGARLGGSPDR
jgi:hypothetical protein